MGKNKTHEEFMRDFKERQPENFEKIEVLGVYIKSKEKIKCRCRIDGYKWEVIPNSLLQGHGCPKCGIKKCTNSNTKTHEEFTEDFKEKQPENFEKVELLGAYINSKEKIKCRCRIDGYEWEVIPDSLLQGYGCPKCVGKKKKTHEEFIHDFEELQPKSFEKIEILEKYETTTKKIKCRCKVDNWEWEVRPNDLLKGSGCPRCAGKNRTHKQFMEDFKKKYPDNFNKIEVLSKYIKNSEKILCRCKVDKYEWEVIPASLLRGNGCPKCAKSQTSLFEQVIHEAFKEVLGEDKVLHRDKSLIGKELDVYLPDFKIAFEPGSWYWHSNKTENDYDKYLLCKEKGVKLVTIYDSMGDDFDLEFEYNVVKYKRDITKEEIIEFIENQFNILNINKNINWENAFKKSKNSCKGITHEDFINSFKKSNPENFNKIKIISKYIKSNEKIKCKCKIDGYEWEVTPNSLLRGSGCPKCAGVNKKTHKEFICEFKEQQPENFKKIEILEKYETTVKKIKCRCKVDGYEWYAAPIRLLKGSGCPKCGGNIKKTHEEFIKDFRERCPENFEKIEVLGIYDNIYKKIKCKCKIDGLEWEVTPHNLLQKQGCPECAKKKRIETCKIQKEKEEKEN